MKNIGNAIVRLLCSDAGRFPGITLGDIERALRLPHGTATHQRITEKREQGYPIRAHKVNGRWLYHILRAEVGACRERLNPHAERKAA